MIRLVLFPDIMDPSQVLVTGALIAIVKQWVITDWDNTYEGKSLAFSIYM